MCLGVMYKYYYPVVERFILSNSGTKQDAEDIFQETMMVFTENIGKGNFVLTSSLKTYLYAISRNLWLKLLRSRNQYTSVDNIEIPDEEDDQQDVLKENEEFISHLINRIPFHCQQIVDMVYFKNLDVEEVAEKMGYNNSHTASNIKYKCLQHMKKVSREH